MAKAKSSCPKCGRKFAGDESPTAGSRVCPACEAGRGGARSPWFWPARIGIVTVFVATLGFGLFQLSKSLERKPDPPPAPSSTPLGAQSIMAVASQKVNPEPTPYAKPRSEPRPEFANAIWLLPNDADQSDGASYENRLFLEYLRQSLALAAREDFGLRVGDPMLGEAVPVDFPEDRQFRIRGPHVANQVVVWSIALGPKTAEHRLWTGNTLLDLKGPERTQAVALDVAEEQSRDTFRKCLIAAGFAPRTARVSDAPAPPDSFARLETLREADQFAVVRSAHGEIRNRGESPELIEALVRGYAHLGLLTDHHWSTAPDVFRARGLLYAQRWRAREPKSAAALRLRAYAYACAGLHSNALADIEAVAKLADPAPPPRWFAIADAYVHFDLDRLDALRKADDSPLARLAGFLARFCPDSSIASQRAARELLAVDRECHRASDAIEQLGFLTSGGAARDGLAAFLASLRERVREQPGLPRACADALADPDTARIFAQLRAAAHPARDAGEPSWAVLAQVLQDIPYAYAWRRLDAIAMGYGGDTTAEARELRPLLDGHPLVDWIESFESSPARAPRAVLRKLASPPFFHLNNRALAYYWRMRSADPNAAEEVNSRIAHNTAPTYELSLLKLQRSPEEVRRGRLFDLRYISPLSPAAVSGTIALAASRHAPDAAKRPLRRIDDREAKEAEAKVSEFAKSHARHPLVLQALGEYYALTGRPDDAARAWRRSLELSPDVRTHRVMAETYKAQGNEQRWLETLDEAFRGEGFGLDQARVQTEVAQYFLAKKDYRKAEPYARAAAASGASFGLAIAAECLVGLERWDVANEFFATNAARYGIPAFHWYFVCRETGRMERAKAERAVRDLLARLAPAPPTEQAFLAGRFLLAENELPRAERMFEIAHAGKHELAGIFVALTRASRGDADGFRDGLRAISSHVPRTASHHPAGDLIHEWLDRGAVPDDKTIDARLAAFTPQHEADSDFFLGWFFQTRNEPARAKRHWDRLLASEKAARMFKIHTKIFRDAKP